MIENWKLEMVHEVNRIFHNRSISDAAREAGIRQTYEFYRLARHVSTNQLNAVESTRDSVEKWLTGLVAPSSHEPDEAANPVYIRQCGMMTHTQKTQVMVLARSFLKDPWAATKPDGHEARLIAVAEACRTNGLPNEIISMVLDRVQPLDMYRRRFAKPGQQRWLHP